MRRYAYLDHIRWMTVLLVIVYHVCYLFNGVGILGGVPNARNLPFLDTISGTVYPWFMVLLFVVAGMCARFALVQQGNRAFLRNRARKLLVPSTLGLFVLHWVTGYLNIRMGGAMDTIPKPLLYPISVLSGIGPLWFVQLLFLFSAILVLIRRIDRNDRLFRLGEKCPSWLICAFALLIWGAAQVGNMPVITTYRIGIYLTAFLLGYAVFAFSMNVGRQWGLGFLLQSSDKQPAYLWQRYQAFFPQVEAKLRAMKPEEFAQLQQAVISQMLQAPQTLGDEASKLSKDFDRGNMRFDSRDKVVAQIKLLTPQKLADFFHQTVVDPQGMTILSQISGSQNGKADYAQPAGGKVWENVSALQQSLPLMRENE